MTSNMHPHKHLLVKVLEISLRKFLSPKKAFIIKTSGYHPKSTFPKK